jgi:hypothetical protein
MKIKITLITVASMLLFLAHTSAQILVNGGFENWSIGSSTFLDPDGWDTNNGTVTNATVVQGAPRTGNYSVSLVSEPDGFGGHLGGYISINYNGTVRPLNLSGYWKGNFTASANEGINISINVADTSAIINGTGGGNTPPSANLTNWTAFSINVNYTNSVPALTSFIAIALSTNDSITNGQVDDLTMTYVVGINDIIKAHFPSAVLRPDAQNLNHILYVDLLAPESFRINIFNLDGKNVYSRDFNLPGGHHEFSIPTEDLPRGMYLCSVTGNGMQQGIKFVK